MTEEPCERNDHEPPRRDGSRTGRVSKALRVTVGPTSPPNFRKIAAMKARPAVLLTLLLSAAPLAAKETVPFIDNDYQVAIARAKAKNVPVFVEAWAPW